MTEPVTTPASPQAVAALSDLETDWRRLDPRMLLVHIVQETIRFLPVLLGILILGRGDDGRPPWVEYVFVPLVVGVSLLRYLTTRYRITNGQIELRKGLLNKTLLATPADRVRTVDVTSSPIHRVLGLGKVELGTAGSGHGDRLVLDALTLPEAHHLRDELIHLRAATATPAAPPGISAGSTAPPPTGEPYALAPPAPPADAPLARVETETELLRLDPRWVRYAPVTMTGVVSALAIFGFANQFITRILERGVLTEAFDRIGDYAWWVDSLVGVVALLVIVTVLSVIGYLLQFWGFRLTRHSGGTLHVTRGLLTSRATSIEEKRIRGLEVGEPLGLRLVGGGRLHVITTGLSRREDRRGTAWLVPPAPRRVVEEVATAVVDDPSALSAPLTQHGTAARRRRYVRALVPALTILLVVLLLTIWRQWPVGLAVAAFTPTLVMPFVARDRYAGLGHHLTASHLVVRAGSFLRRRDVVQRTGIIGWNFHSSWFQRRVGLAHLTATTAAGKQGYTAYDLPVGHAVALAHEIDPALIRQFLA
ncbi:MAG TPA: PH domain-containing protein [Lapillicoccus sp.]|nr:PH domain-containing protein [Lapillicoccus sp.]